MSAEYPTEPMDGDDYPFKEMQSSGHQWDREEFINIDEPDDEAKDAVKKDNMLAILGLSAYSKASDVRRIAFDLRNKAAKSGVTTDKLNALSWVLSRTRDCINEDEFTRFIRYNWSFDEIRFGRNR